MFKGWKRCQNILMNKISPKKHTTNTLATERMFKLPVTITLIRQHINKSAGRSGENYKLHHPVRSCSWWRAFGFKILRQPPSHLHVRSELGRQTNQHALFLTNSLQILCILNKSCVSFQVTT